MNIEILEKAEQLAAKTDHLLIATADKECWPHIAAAGRLALSPEKYVEVTDWFCPGTIANLKVNPRISLVVWDHAADVGYQMVGEVKDVKDLCMLDGYAPQVEGKIPTPQVERQLLVHIYQAFEFRHAPHTDIEE